MNDWKKLSLSSKVKALNNAEYVVINLCSFCDVHIDKNNRELFQENRYHINEYENCKNDAKKGRYNIGVFFYIIANSCVTLETLIKWDKYIDFVFFKKTAVK